MRKINNHVVLITSLCRVAPGSEAVCETSPIGLFRADDVDVREGFEVLELEVSNFDSGKGAAVFTSCLEAFRRGDCLKTCDTRSPIRFKVRNTGDKPRFFIAALCGLLVT